MQFGNVYERLESLLVPKAGQYVTAITGVEIALWDLAGKALDLPIYQLMGGKFRDRVRMYCDSDMDDPLAGC
jgi:L-alanine-DL-glutamate epimerase-like enolase superfamily enzyme